MPRDFLAEHNDEFSEVMEHLRKELSVLRTGRATPAMVEQIQVEAYGGMQPVVALASITSLDARTLGIEPWDKTLLKPMETALMEARLGMNPVVTGTIIRMSLPSPTEESRRGLVKILGEKLEQARIGVRSIRDEIKSQIQASEKAKEIAEDEKYKLLAHLDQVAAGMNERIKHMGDEKEKEIMTI